MSISAGFTSEQIREFVHEYEYWTLCHERSDATSPPHGPISLDPPKRTDVAAGRYVHRIKDLGSVLDPFSWMTAELESPAAVSHWAPDPDASALAERWVETREHVAVVAGWRDRATAAAASAPRWRSRSTRRELGAVTDELRVAQERFERLQDSLAWTGVGATSTWTALSTFGVGKQGLEGTIRCHRENLTPSFVHGVLRDLPEVRVANELHLAGGADLLGRLHSELLGEVVGCTDPEAAKALLEHLPGELRPLPPSVEGFRDTPHVRLCVSQPDHRFAEDGQTLPIKLHDIVVRDVRGRGLGTATLTHLLRFADHHQHVIVGELVPTHGAPPETTRALARWYASHAFRVGDLPPDEWRVGSRMRRHPMS